MPRFAFRHMWQKVAVEEWPGNVAMLALDIASIASVAYVLGRTAWTCSQGKRIPDSAIEKKLCGWTAALLVVDLLYHAIDFFFTADVDSPLIYVAMKETHMSANFAHAVEYNMIREAFGVLSLWGHLNIARVIYSWIVLKYLRRPRLHIQLSIFLFIIAVTALRISLLRLRRSGTILAEVVIFHGVVVPVLLAYIVRCYVLIIKEARAMERTARDHVMDELDTTVEGQSVKGRAPFGAAGSSEEEEEETVMDRREGIEGVVAVVQGKGPPKKAGGEKGISGKDADTDLLKVVREDVEEKGGYDDPEQQAEHAHRQMHIHHLLRLRRQTICVLCILLFVWLTSSISELLIWLWWAEVRRRAPAALYWARLVASRSIGLMDTLLVGRFCLGTESDTSHHTHPHERSRERRHYLSPHANAHKATRTNGSRC